MKKGIKGFIVGALVVTMCAGLVGCSSKPKDTAPPAGTPEGTPPAVTEGSNQLKVGMECGYAPFNWTQLDDSNGAVPIQGDKAFANGYDVQIAKKVAESMGKELVIVKTAWDGLIVGVQSGHLNAVMAGMSPTVERMEKVDFSENYYSSDLVMVVKADGKYAEAKSLADFNGAKITAQLGTFHETVIDQIEGVAKQTSMDDFGAMRVALQSGVIDGYVSELPEGKSASAAMKDFTYVEFAKGEGFEFRPDDAAIAVAVKKGESALIEEINKALAEISQEDRLKIMDEAIANQPTL